MTPLYLERSQMQDKGVNNKDNNSVTPPNKKQNLNQRYQRDKDREKVKGIFKFHEVPGSELSFVYRKYKEDQVEKYKVVDGHVYTLPLGVAKHLNRSGWYPIHAHCKDENGNPSIKIGKKVRRFSFQSLEFMDLDDLSPDKDIITIEKA